MRTMENNILCRTALLSLENHWCQFEREDTHHTTEGKVNEYIQNDIIPPSPPTGRNSIVSGQYARADFLYLFQRMSM